MQAKVRLLFGVLKWMILPSMLASLVFSGGGAAQAVDPVVFKSADGAVTVTITVRAVGGDGGATADDLNTVASDLEFLKTASPVNFVKEVLTSANRGLNDNKLKVNVSRKNSSVTLGRVEIRGEAGPCNEIDFDIADSDVLATALGGTLPAKDLRQIILAHEVQHTDCYSPDPVLGNLASGPQDRLLRGFAVDAENKVAQDLAVISNITYERQNYGYFAEVTLAGGVKATHCLVDIKVNGQLKTLDREEIRRDNSEFAFPCSGESESVSVGGITGVVGESQPRGESANPPSAPPLAPIAAAAGVVALGAGAWYTRHRWIR